MSNLIDSTQIAHRAILQQIIPYATSSQLDQILRSINLDLTDVLKVDASSVPSLVITIGPSIVNNTESNRQKSIPYIVSSLPNFTSGTVTFPSTSGGTITPSPGSGIVLTLPSNQFTKVLISLDQSGNLVVTQGNNNASESLAIAPAPVPATLSVAYISLFNNAGTISNITQNKIFKFSALEVPATDLSSLSTVKFTLSGEAVPFTCIDGTHFQTTSRSLSIVNISALNSGTSGSTVVQVNQYRSGSLFNSATASLPASAGNPSGVSAALSGTLSLIAGDIITVDVNSIAGGTPSELSVEY
jgi:hypothetical protein